MKNNKLKQIPKFKSEKAEREFWSKNDSSEYINWAEAKEVVFPNLKPSSKTISIRLPESLLYTIKSLANKHDVPYQSYMKLLLGQAVKKS